VKLPRLRAKTRSSRLEAKFALYWRGLAGPELRREFVFHAERKWRADFAHVESRTLIEVEGGIFIKGGGRHNRAAGFIADAEKYLEAFLDGWSVVRLTEAQITAPNVERIIRRVRDKTSCECSHRRTRSNAEMPAHALENMSASPVVAEP
jgi:very-short-patch-repair endonuclease